MSQITPRDLNRHLVFLNRKRRQFMAERLRSQGLYGPMYSFLLCLEKNPGSSQDFLCDFYSIDKGSVARLSKKLQDLGLITRTISPTDHRLYQLDVTDKGRETLLLIHDYLNQWSEKMLVGFTADDRQIAGSFLQRMADNIKD